ncbi:uncharacterized protein B0H18DRAFT_975705, partial [Fomitopsis serialis]|uniref:uncharacterized protein n=1 Tax=Fomitopsis serialis TaxID=139415 RepID=UPI0020078320
MAHLRRLVRAFHLSMRLHSYLLTCHFCWPTHCRSYLLPRTHSSLLSPDTLRLCVLVDAPLFTPPDMSPFGPTPFVPVDALPFVPADVPLALVDAPPFAVLYSPT